MGSFSRCRRGIGSPVRNRSSDQTKGESVVSRPAMRDVCAIAPNGSRVSWHPPQKWKRQPVAPSFAAVSIEHYIAGATEIVDLETTGPMLGMYLKAPTTLELRTSGGGWAPTRIHGPLAYVPPGFSFSGRWSDEIEWITVHFDPSWLSRTGLQTDVWFASAALRMDVIDDLLTQIVRSLHEDAVAGMPQGPTYAEALGSAALHRMLHLESRPQAKQYAHAAMMRKACEYIRDNFQGPLTLTRVADAVGYPGDLYSFIRSFRKANGLTPHQYIIESRLQAARGLIERGQRDVTEAALDCGFSSASHFSATFRKRWGVSPSELKPRAAIVMPGEARESTGR
ncbi:AraC family transcriptional regulator [Burkholderia cepacia]|uniref:AraC family transcriptional regulator n=2 Tax=Burkholderia cepacia TaxID=292 RepID=A0A104A498_BURCE|nr:AraC family transcriptional regulator [Burkholderia cepacia]KVK91453.1 AraC family transcriptional regulator [Burkholderia cepacia]KVL54318.1 AraC family transcriptional regulator [Burkholderia cepacia]